MQLLDSPRLNPKPQRGRYKPGKEASYKFVKVDLVAEADFGTNLDELRANTSATAELDRVQDRLYHRLDGHRRIAVHCFATAAARAAIPDSSASDPRA